MLYAVLDPFLLNKICLNQDLGFGTDTGSHFKFGS